MRRATLLVVLLALGCGGHVSELEHCEEFSTYRPAQSDGLESAWTFKLLEGERGRCDWTGPTEWRNVEIVRDGGWRRLTFTPAGSIATMDVLDCDETASEGETFCGPAGAWGDFTVWTAEQ